MTMRQPWREDEKNAAHELDLADSAVFAFSCILIMAFGLMPIVDASLRRSPVILMPLAIALFVTIASALILRRRHSWLDFVLYVFGQIAIWLSIFCMSLVGVLYVSS